MPYRLGIDIGGTFTDASLLDETTGELRIAKTLSTPRDPSIGFLAATERILREAGVAPGDLRYVVHATTVATNAIIEGKVAPTGFITTDGFRDMLVIGRQIRPSLYDLQFEKPRPLVPRTLCFGVPERLDARGAVLVPLDEAALRQVAARLKAEGVGAVAVCFLHAYTNPVHERQAKAILADAFPDAAVSISSEVAPEIREYYRASTTVINASIRPIVDRYLAHIEARLREAGVRAELLVMQSSGGVYTFDAAREKPVFMVESGPAAGVIAASYLGGALGFRDVLSFDMGGTTAKAGLTQHGQPRVSKDYEVGATAQSGSGRGRGSGYPIRTPVIDLVEIGAGGGSIAWVDSGGSLRVGPQSAGADPGPVCYGRGGTEPTVTDANLVLGRLNPHNFLGGEMTLDVAGARQAIETRCARPLGVDVVTAAHAIIEIANAAMVTALRLVSVQRGYDPRDFVLIGFGGAGPAHANRLAAELEVPTTLIPMSPGIFSALGLLVTDLKHDYSTTLIQRTDRLDGAAIEAAYQAMTDAGRAMLEREGVAAEMMAFVRQVDMRYVGQSFELTLPLPDDGALTATQLASLEGLFHREHERAYGHCAPDEPTEFVNLRLTALGRIAKPRLREIAVGQAEGAALPSPPRGRGVGGEGHAQQGRRAVYFAESGSYVATAVYDRYRLVAEQVIVGPAVVEEFDSTTVIHPGYQARVDKYGNLMVTAQ